MHNEIHPDEIAFLAKGRPRYEDSTGSGNGDAYIEMRQRQYDATAERVGKLLSRPAPTPRPPEAAPARPMEPCDKCGGSGLVRKFDLRDPQDEDCEEDVPVRKGNQKPGELWLYDRADGVKGHFCVGRTMDGFCHEYWSEAAGKFCAFGTLYESEAAANRMLRKLAATLAPASPARKEADHG